LAFSLFLANEVYWTEFAFNGYCKLRMDVGRVRKIIHVDMDAFYASVEQRDNPALKGKPVAVGYPARRGVVAAASYEARRFGVHSAMPSITAKRLCPDLIFVTPRFDVYRAVSNQIHLIFADYTGLIEPLALDEAYLDVTRNRQEIATAWATAKAIRARILKETGLTASAGISYNKFLAKLASGQRKPNGQYAITPEMGETFIESLPVDKFHGVGPVTAKKMHALGIQTGADLKNRSLADLKRNFGKAGSWYYDIARGRDEREVNPNRERKSISSETTFAADLTDPATIETGVISMADEVWEWLEKADARARTVSIKIKWADFRQSTRSRSLPKPLASQRQLHQIVLDLIRSVFPPQNGIRLVGVTLSNFRASAPSLAMEQDIFNLPVISKSDLDVNSSS
jgi:DNA polymerase-4